MGSGVKSSNKPLMLGDDGRRRSDVVKGLIRRMRAHFSDSVRVLAFVVLRPASYLPRPLAFAAADAIGFLYYLTPMGARVRKSMRIAFPSRDASKLTREWMTRPFRDYISASRNVARRDVADQRPMESRGPPAILREPGQSVIVATGHFSREPMACLYAASVIPKKLSTVVAALDRRSLKPRALRLRLQFGIMVEAIRAIRENEVDIVHVGRPGLMTRLVKHLRAPDAAVLISSDAVLAGGRETGHHRPFAGHAMVDFALGTARLSRLSQRPVVACVPFLDETGRTILEWSEPIPAPARHDESADARITSAIVDILERAVGLRPGQYVLPIGEERQWSETTELWVDQPSRSNSADRPDQATASPATTTEPDLPRPTMNDQSIDLQRNFWDAWNASNREHKLSDVSLDQRHVVIQWLRSLGRNDLNIIEVGCGAGWLCPSLKSFGQVTATDLSEHVLARAAERNPDVRFVAGDFMTLEFKPDSFDVVISLEVLSHVSDHADFIQKLSTLLRPGGVLMLATQNRPVLERFNRVEKQQRGQLRRWFDRDELAALLQPHFEVQELKTITPTASKGPMRLLAGRKTKRLIRAIAGRSVERGLASLGFGWTLITLARKRDNATPS